MFLSSHTHTQLIPRYTKFTISRAVTQKRTQSSEEDKQASARQEPTRSTTQSTQTTDVSFVPVVVCRVSYRRCRRPFANTSQSRTHHGQSARSLIPSVLRNTLRRVALFTVTHCARQQAFGRVVVSYFALLGTARVRLRCCCNPHTHTHCADYRELSSNAQVCVCARCKWTEQQHRDQCAPPVFRPSRLAWQRTAVVHKEAPLRPPVVVA